MEIKDIYILLIDDDVIVHKAMTRVMEDKGIINPLLKAKNGEDGLAALRHPDGPRAKGHPMLVILDLNMPKMDGHEFLKEMRADAKLNNVPVFVLTTSSATRDMNNAYAQNVVGYVIKDDLSESLEKALAILEQTWRFK